MSDERGQDKQIRIPVRFLGDDRPVYYYGGPLPSFESGTIAEVVVPESALVDPDEAARLRHEPLVELLPTGTSLHVEVSRDTLPATLTRNLQPGPAASEGLEIQLREPVRLRLRGHRSGRLEDGKCWLPALGREADGLDQALRAIADATDAPRRPKPDEVLRRVHVRAGSDWRSLDDLRRDQEAVYDMRLSATGARVLDALPTRVGGWLQVCWLGELESGEVLSQSLRDYRGRLHELAAGTDLPDLDTADRLVERCLDLVGALADDAPEGDRRLVQATVRYLVRDEDEERDSESPIGFLDDALVVRTVAEVMSDSA